MQKKKKRNLFWIYILKSLIKTKTLIIRSLRKKTNPCVKKNNNFTNIFKIIKKKRNTCVKKM